MIAGLNPCCILRIEARGFRRRGNHPYLDTITAKCNWYNKVWLYFNYKFMNNGMFDYAQAAEVYIIGADGCHLTSIPCNSNAAAAKLCAALTQELSDFVDRFGTCSKGTT